MATSPAAAGVLRQQLALGRPILLLADDILRFMKVSAPPLLPLLRSLAQVEILSAVFLGPGALSVADVARAAGTSEATALR